MGEEHGLLYHHGVVLAVLLERILLLQYLDRSGSTLLQSFLLALRREGGIGANVVRRRLVGDLTGLTGQIFAQMFLVRELLLAGDFFVLVDLKDMLQLLVRLTLLLQLALLELLVVESADLLRHIHAFIDIGVDLLAAVVVGQF